MTPDSGSSVSTCPRPDDAGRSLLLLPFLLTLSVLLPSSYGQVAAVVAQHSTAQHSTAQHSTAQHSTAQHQHSFVHYSTMHHDTLHDNLHSAVINSITYMEEDTILHHGKACSGWEEGK